MQTTKLTSKSILPLTCSRSGTCCFGKAVMLNPWEIVCFSKAKKITPREFRDLYSEFGGIQLRFDGKEDKKGQKSCSQYIPNFGCSVHINLRTQTPWVEGDSKIHPREITKYYTSVI